jgi:hypothetical protein
MDFDKRQRDLPRRRPGRDPRLTGSIRNNNFPADAGHCIPPGDPHFWNYDLLGISNGISHASPRSSDSYGFRPLKLLQHVQREHHSFRLSSCNGSSNASCSSTGNRGKWKLWAAVNMRFD